MQENTFRNNIKRLLFIFLFGIGDAILCCLYNDLTLFNYFSMIFIVFDDFYINCLSAQLVKYISLFSLMFLIKKYMWLGDFIWNSNHILTDDLDIVRIIFLTVFFNIYLYLFKIYIYDKEKYSNIFSFIYSIAFFILFFSLNSILFKKNVFLSLLQHMIKFFYNCFDYLFKPAVYNVYNMYNINNQLSEIGFAIINNCSKIFIYESDDEIIKLVLLKNMVKITRFISMNVIFFLITTNNIFFFGYLLNKKDSFRKIVNKTQVNYYYYITAAIGSILLIISYIFVYKIMIAISLLLLLPSLCVIYLHGYGLLRNIILSKSSIFIVFHFIIPLIRNENFSNILTFICFGLSIKHLLMNNHSVHDQIK